MKIPTDNLYQLIQAMTASEKRYFKRHYASEKSITTELFDFINGMKAYDEEEVKLNFSNSKVAKNLKVYKVQLTELLLKSLTSYHNKKSIRSKIRIGLEEVELLMYKQLYTLAGSRIRKIKELCLKYEELEYIFSVLFFELLLNSFFDVKLQTSENPILEELDQYTDKIKNIYRLKKINFALHDISNNKLTHRLSPEEAERFSQQLEIEAARIHEDPISFNEHFYLNSSLSLINQLFHQDPTKEYLFKKKNVELFEENPHFIENHGSFYYAALYNYLIACRKLGKKAAFAEGIRKIKELARQQPLLDRNLIFVYYLEIKEYFRTGQFETLIAEMEPVVTRHIKKYDQNQDNLPALCFIYFAMAHMVLEQSQRVQFYVRRLQAMGKQLNTSYAYFFNIFELISHYETNDFGIVQNLLTSFRRKIDKTKSAEVTFYLQFLDFMTELIQAAENERTLQAKSFKQNIVVPANDGVSNLSEAFLLNDWLQAIEKKCSYTKWVKSQLVDSEM